WTSRSRSRIGIAARPRQGRARARGGGRTHTRRVQETRHRARNPMRQWQGGPQAGRPRIPFRHVHQGLVAASRRGGKRGCRARCRSRRPEGLAEGLYVTANADKQQYRDEVGELIADYVVSVPGRLDARAERAAKAVLIDTMAVAMAALRHPAAQNARKHAYRFSANGAGCAIWGTPKRAAPELAALTNGVLLRCHDYNDFFVGRRNSGHSSDILSGVIAAAEWTNAPGKKLLSAVAIGYEMVGAAFDAFSTAQGGWDYTNLMALGATAAIARLLNLNADQTREAMGLTAPWRRAPSRPPLTPGLGSRIFPGSNRYACSPRRAPTITWSRYARTRGIPSRARPPIIPCPISSRPRSWTVPSGWRASRRMWFSTRSARRSSRRSFARLRWSWARTPWASTSASRWAICRASRSSSTTAQSCMAMRGRSPGTTRIPLP